MVRQEGKAAAPSSVVDEEWMERVSLWRGGPLGQSWVGVAPLAVVWNC